MFMGTVNTEQFVRFFEEKFDDSLRSVIHYQGDRYELLHLREDVRREYTDEEIDVVARDLEMESMGKLVEESRFTHGELRCRVSCFDDGTEMNFAFGGGEGLAVGLDGNAFVTQETFIGRCLEMAGIEDD